MSNKIEIIHSNRSYFSVGGRQVFVALTNAEKITIIKNPVQETRKWVAIAKAWGQQKLLWLWETENMYA